MAPKKVAKKQKARHHIETIDFYGNPVHCTAHQWNTHIIEALDGHPEMAGREHDVRKAIEDPDAVRHSTKTGTALAFERVTSADTVRVIVFYADANTMKAGGSSGVVATAYPDSSAYSSQVGGTIYTKPKKGGGA